MTTKTYIAELTIPTQCSGMEYKRTAIVTAGEKRAAIRKFLFHINEDLHKINCHIDIDVKLHHPTEFKDEKTRLATYFDDDRSFRIIIRELNRHRDFIDITNIENM